MAGEAFTPGSIYDNIDAVVRAIGFTQPGVVWSLAQVSWDSLEDRNNFLDQLIKRDYFDVVGRNEGGV
jgi:hypothetical protein